MLKRKRSDHWNWSHDDIEVVENLNESSIDHDKTEKIIKSIEDFIASDKKAPAVNTSKIKKRPPKTMKLGDFDVEDHHDVHSHEDHDGMHPHDYHDDYDDEADMWHPDPDHGANHPDELLKKVNDKMISKQEKEHYAPKGAHIMTFDHGTGQKLVSYHTGDGGSDIMDADEYHKKFVPDYHKMNDTGAIYKKYNIGSNEFTTQHGSDGHLETVPSGVKKTIDVMDHMKVHGHDVTDGKNITMPKLYPEGSYENPYKNKGLGVMNRYDDKGDNYIKKADYYDRSKVAKLNRKNLDHLKAHHNSLTETEKYHLRNYKVSSNDTNRLLRSNDDFYADNRKKKIGEYQEKYDALDRATSHHLVEDMHVYRGFDSSRSKRSEKDRIRPEMMKPGFTFKDHGYTGTSLNSSVARSHSNHVHEDKNEKDHWGGSKQRTSVFKIHLPKGTKGHFFDHENNSFEDEQEFVLHRGSTFMVTHHSMDHDTHFVHLKVVKQDHHGPAGPVGKDMTGPKLNFSKYRRNLYEGKTIKDRSDHWNWSDEQVERIKKDDKNARLERKKKDRSAHWNWSEDDVEEVRPPNATLHEDLHPAAGVPGPHLTPMPDGSISRPYKKTGEGPTPYSEWEGIDYETGQKVTKNNGGSAVVADKYNREKVLEKNKVNLDHYKAHHDTLNGADRKYIGSYKRQSSETNGKLRAKRDPRMIGDLKKEIAKSPKYKALDKITSHPTKEHMVVYRGYDYALSRKDYIPHTKGFGQFKKGFTFKDHGYTGTSLNAETARTHSKGSHTEGWDDSPNANNYGNRKNHKRAIFAIHLPKGTKGHYFDHHENEYDSEQEFVLHRGTSFKVTHHSQDDDTHFIHVKVVHQESHHKSKLTKSKLKLLKQQAADRKLTKQPDLPFVQGIKKPEAKASGLKEFLELNRKLSAL